MTYTRLSFGLGLFSIALGAAELLASRRIARSLSAEHHQNLVKAFGAREIAAGVGLLAAPAHSTRVWNRVAGDGLDIGALALAARRDPRNKLVWGALAFVAGATVLDIVVARGLDANTARASSLRSASSQNVAASATS